MKGFVLTIGKRQKTVHLPDFKKNGLHFRQLLSQYGIQAVFSALFLMGLVVGALSGRQFGEDTFQKLDMLFVTNIGARMEMSFFEIFNIYLMLLH
jgi:hypothetical protein